MMWCLGDVYIIFGDSARSDGSNIYGVFKNLQSAEEQKKHLEEWSPFEEFHIEVHGLYE